jgi:hypothetical protein
MLDDEIFVGAENGYNMFTVRKNADATTEEDRERLEVCGGFHTGEFVNAIKPGTCQAIRECCQYGPTILFVVEDFRCTHAQSAHQLQLMTLPEGACTFPFRLFRLTRPLMMLPKLVALLSRYSMLPSARKVMCTIAMGDVWGQKSHVSRADTWPNDHRYRQFNAATPLAAGSVVRASSENPDSIHPSHLFATVNGTLVCLYRAGQGRKFYRSWLVLALGLHVSFRNEYAEKALT